MTLGGKLLKAVILDRDYRSENEVSEVLNELSKFTYLSHIHCRKELENYLLEVPALDRTLKRKIADYNKRNESDIRCDQSVEAILMRLTDSFKSKVSGQYIAKEAAYEKAKNKGLDDATINQRLIEKFEEIWRYFDTRISVVPGKEILAQLNQHFQEKYKVSVSPKSIINEMRPDEVPKEMVELIERLDIYRKQTTA